MALVSKAETGDREIVEEPHLAQLRNEVSELQRIVDAEPDDITVTRAWASIFKTIEALKDLCPNHREILRYR
jgi:hypothetical protein